jgi:hypothetical protein
MTLVNEVGDVVVTDSAAMRALADPSVLAALERMRREGPATAEELPVQERQLEELETFGLVTRKGESWAAVGKGFAFQVPDDPKGQAAARQLSNVMMAGSLDLPKEWLADEEPRLERDWIRAAGLFNARVMVTPDELDGLQESLERLLAPYITREPDAVPAEARRARVLTYFLPEAPD